MIIKLEKIVSCSSEHPSYPASNLLHNPPPGPWKCAKPGEMLATVVFELPESSCIIGLDIGNYRSCVVIVTASTFQEPDNWIPILNHQFLTHDEAVNNKFKDHQVQLFTKKELNVDTIKRKFDRVKVTCMQSANLKELFGLDFITLHTEVVVDMGIDIFDRFKLRTEDPESKSRLSFKEKCVKLFIDKQKNLKEDLVESEDKEAEKRPLEKLEVGESDEICGKENDDLISSSSSNSNNFNDNSCSTSNDVTNNKNERLSDVVRTPYDNGLDEASTSQSGRNKLTKDDNDNCSICSRNPDELCKTCKKISAPTRDESPPRKKAKIKKAKKKTKKEFSKLMDDVKFSLSGYVNPQRDEIRRKALKMGAKYIADPNLTSNICTHLICAFKNTPKYQQLRGHAKIVSQVFIEECFDDKKRYPWRRYALSSSDRRAAESEEEIEGSTSPVRPPNPYEQDTDSDTNDEDY